MKVKDLTDDYLNVKFKFEVEKKIITGIYLGKRQFAIYGTWIKELDPNHEVELEQVIDEKYVLDVLHKIRITVESEMGGWVGTGIQAVSKDRLIGKDIKLMKENIVNTIKEEERKIKDVVK